MSSDGVWVGFFHVVNNSNVTMMFHKRMKCSCGLVQRLKMSRANDWHVSVKFQAQHVKVPRTSSLAIVMLAETITVLSDGAAPFPARMARMRTPFHDHRTVLDADHQPRTASTPAHAGSDPQVVRQHHHLPRPQVISSSSFP